MSAPQLTPEEILALPAVVKVWPTVGGQIYGLGKSVTYELAARNELPVPVFRVGVTYRARLVDIVRQLGLDAEGNDSTTPAAA
jgi:hypothetical protein